MPTWFVSENGKTYLEADYVKKVYAKKVSAGKHVIVAQDTIISNPFDTEEDAKEALHELLKGTSWDNIREKLRRKKEEAN